MTKEEVKATVKMADVLAMHGIQLIRNKCCCPFHNEKTPSFTVFSDGTAYHCFGCGTSGDVFSFIMKIQNCDFKQALATLGGENKKQFKPIISNYEREKQQKQLNFNNWSKCLDEIRAKQPPPMEINIDTMSEEELEKLFEFADKKYVQLIHKLPYLEYRVFEE